MPDIAACKNAASQRGCILPYTRRGAVELLGDETTDVARSAVSPRCAINFRRAQVASGDGGGERRGETVRTTGQLSRGHSLTLKVPSSRRDCSEKDTRRYEPAGKDAGKGKVFGARFFRCPGLKLLFSQQVSSSLTTTTTTRARVFAPLRNAVYS